MSNYKVRLVPISSLKFGDADTIATSQVVFEVTPTFTESRSVDYAAVTPVHMPGSIQMYRNTGSRTFEVGAHLVSRNGEDATNNKRTLQLLRGWTMPYFGTTDTLTTDNKTARADTNSYKGSTAGLSQDQIELIAFERLQSEGIQLRGAPPDVLYLYAYSTESSTAATTRQGQTSNINRIPVVLVSLNIVYPDDVDYIPIDMGSGNIEPFPVKMDVSLSLTETHSPREFEQFDLAAFKTGNLANF